MNEKNTYVPSRLAIEKAVLLKAEIELFHAEYCAALDGGDVERWPDFFTPDALYRITSRENAELNLPVGLVYAEGRDMMHDRAVAISRTQMFAPRYLLHIVSNVRVIDDKGSEVEAHATFLLMQTLVEGPTTVHLAGSYHDVFVREHGRLLLKRRDVIYDTNILANDLVHPV
ncbi:aromatic-ring-hydroxylating dioxygenase subunit beta [Bordetella genomosp. 4]|uniref:Ring-hydroxylating dioxygenase subunit beta n=1 Tax=Bordetella genomosp. 4 TaxID=463044 RepID=A0A261U263_9BORD|nr:nuclear transport factor 2 family protein [Bordetella genomosp. 4]OZI56054.1 ring-hydroxylating dioxygenase subunit beta [Bordetella genomosp. 4]